MPSTIFSPTVRKTLGPFLGGVPTGLELSKALQELDRLPPHHQLELTAAIHDREKVDTLCKLASSSDGNLGNDNVILTNLAVALKNCCSLASRTQLKLNPSEELTLQELYEELDVAWLGNGLTQKDLPTWESSAAASTAPVRNKSWRNTIKGTAPLFRAFELEKELQDSKALIEKMKQNEEMWKVLLKRLGLGSTSSKQDLEKKIQDLEEAQNDNARLKAELATRTGERDAARNDLATRTGERDAARNRLLALLVPAAAPVVPPVPPAPIIFSPARPLTTREKIAEIIHHERHELNTI